MISASTELVAHPCSALLVFGLVAAVLRGRSASIAMLLGPLLGMWIVYDLGLTLKGLQEANPMLEGFSSSLTLFGYEMTSVLVDKQSLLFGYLFHLAALIAGIYSFHLRDPWQLSMGLLYAASAVGVAFAGDLLCLFLWWEALAITSVFQIWCRRTDKAEKAGFRYLFFHISSGLLLLCGIVFRYHGEGETAFALNPLTEDLEAGDLGAWLILLAIGVKAAFPGLHVWLKDGYAEATATGPVWLCAFTTKAAVCMLARLFPGADVLMVVGVSMAMFPIFFAVIENDLRRVLCYSKINQIGFMVVGIGIGTPLAIDGAIAHVFTHVIYKGLLFMSMGAVLFRTGEIRGSELGGLYKSMPWTTGFCIIGAASISAFPLFSGFVSKSMIMLEAAAQGHHLLWFLLLFAAAGVVEHAGIKVPYFAFFSHDSGLRPKEAPFNMLLAMGISSFFCIFLGCNPGWLYSLLPNGALMSDGSVYYPYDFTHVINQTQLLLFAMLAVTFLMLRKTYPPEVRSINLDVDWFYRKAGRFFLKSTSIFWNRLNEWAHSFFIGKVTKGVTDFTKAGHVRVFEFLSDPMHEMGLLGTDTKAKAKNKFRKRTGLGVHQVGLTALVGILFLLLFLILAR